MDIKLKNNRSTRIILFVTMIMSLTLILTSLMLYHKHGGEFYKSKDFYTSADFNRYIYDKYRKMYSVVDEEFVLEDDTESLGKLEYERNIKFMSVNNITNKIYTNTNYNNISEFKDNEKGYIEIEGENYNLNIKRKGISVFKEGSQSNTRVIENDNNKKVIENNNKKLIENENSNSDIVKDISIYAILPEKLENMDTLKAIYKDNMIRYNMMIFTYSIGIIGLIMFIASIVIAIKIGYRGMNRDNKIYIMYSKIFLEIKITFIIAAMFIDFQSNLLYTNYDDLGSVSILKLNPIALTGSILLKVVYITMICILIENIIRGNVLKSSMIYKIIVNFKNTIKNKNIFEIVIKIIIMNITLYITLNIFRFDYNIRPIMSISMFISLIVFTSLIMSNLSHLLLVVKRIKDDKKIGLIKEIILISIIIIIINIPIIISFGMPILAFISFILFTLYIIVRLSYLNEIMEGVKKIESGDINYKIDVKGNDSFTLLAENINGIGNGLDNAIDERMRSEKMKSELITNVSHDLKTPLTSILNYVDLLKKEEVKPEYLNDYIAILDKKSKRLKILIEDLFEAAKATSGSVELNIEKIQLNQLLTQSIAEMENKILESNLDMKVNFPEEKVYINADGKKLFRVFENLISNIVKYSLNGTRVYVDMSSDYEYAYINFKNISAYELNFDEGEITERFKRGDISRSEEGAGLGLSIAKGLVELQGGEFTIQTDGDLFKAIVKLKISKE